MHTHREIRSASLIRLDSDRREVREGIKFPPHGLAVPILIRKRLRLPSLTLHCRTCCKVSQMVQLRSLGRLPTQSRTLSMRCSISHRKMRRIQMGQRLPACQEKQRGIIPRKAVHNGCPILILGEEVLPMAGRTRKVGFGVPRAGLQDEPMADLTGM